MAKTEKEHRNGVNVSSKLCFFPVVETYFILILPLNNPVCELL